MMVLIVSVCVIAVSSIYYNYKFVRYDSEKIVFGATYMTMNNSFYKAITDEIEKQINEIGMFAEQINLIPIMNHLRHYGKTPNNICKKNSPIGKNDFNRLRKSLSL